MTEHDHLEDALASHYRATRARDRAVVPSFATLAAAARTGDIRRPSAVEVIELPRWRHLAWMLPMAACLALLLRLDLAGGAADDADAAFDALITDWARTSAAVVRTPTDALLDAPGTELLRGTLRLPTGVVPVTPRSRS